MLDNIVTLPVDVLGNGTLVDQDYTRYDDSTPNRSSYIGEDHSLSVRNKLDFYRSMPKKAANFNGVGKSGAKITQDVTVPGVDSTTTITAPIIMELSASIPVGASTADCMEVRQRLIAVLDAAIAARLQEKLEV